MKGAEADARGATSAISVIMLIALVVVVSAGVGVYALGITQNVQEVPVANAFDHECGDYVTPGSDEVRVVYEGGEPLPEGRLKIAAPGKYPRIHPRSWGGGDPDDEVVAGDTAVLDGYGFVKSGSATDTVNIVWTSEDGSETTIIKEFELTEKCWQ